MALTDDDLSRITDKFKIGAAEVMETHMEKIHEPLYRRVSDVEKGQTFFRGALWVGGVLFAIALALIERGH